MSNDLSCVVCMCTYNGERYLHEQITTVLSALSQNDKLFISDNGSSDRTLDIIKSFHDPRISLVVNVDFLGPVKNFNFILQAAVKEFPTYDVIVFADQDDVWERNRLEAIRSYHKSYDLVVVNAKVINGESLLIREKWFAVKNPISFIGNFIKFKCLGCVCSFRMDTLKRFLPCDSAPMHDIHFVMLHLFYHRSIFVDQCLISYRRHTDNFSTSGGKSASSFKAKFYNRLYIIIALLRYGFCK